MNTETLTLPTEAQTGPVALAQTLRIRMSNEHSWRQRHARKKRLRMTGELPPMITAGSITETSTKPKQRPAQPNADGDAE